MPTKTLPQVREISSRELNLYTRYLQIADIDPERLDPIETSSLKLVLLPKQQYGNPPTALQNFNDLIVSGCRFIHHLPGQMRNLNEVTPEHVGKIIVIYHTIYYDVDSVRGFLAIRFNEDKSQNWFFVPLEARIGSRYFALCQK